MKNFYFFRKLFSCITCILFFAILSPAAIAHEGEKAWSMAFENSKAFIENKGQFRPEAVKEPVLYAYDNGSSMIYFTAKGIAYTFTKRWKKDEGDDKEKAREKYHEQMRGFKNVEEFMEKERKEHEVNVKSDLVGFSWENANADSKVEVSEPTSDYFSYTFKDVNGREKNENFISGYKKLVYKNIYPNIDVEYTFHPVEGIKYALILHPGADISQVKMRYTDNVKLKDNGDLHISTKFGDIIDHAPLSFYENNKSAVIASHFAKDGKTVSFQLANYDHSKTLIIDPWTQTPTLPASNGVWECEKDAGGNAYIIGGETPMKLRKYSPAGAIVWTFTTAYDTSNSEWLGSMATDLAGNSYVTCGSTARMTKVNAAGTQVWAVTGGSFDEYWTIAFNCDQTKLIVGGTRINGAPNGYIFDINTSNGSVNSAIKVGSQRTHTVFGFPVTDGEEVRSITSSRNARYYFLTLDSIGTLDQNFTACSTPKPLWAVNHGYAFGYKCETNRPNNGNGAIVAIKANKNFVYTQNGITVHKRALGSGAILGSAAIPGGISVASGGMNQAGNCGIDIDSCGNVYVGSGNAILKYDANLNLLSNVALSFRVSDVAVSYGGNVFVCGTNNDNSNTARVGYIQQVNMAACDAPVLFCCDATVCPAGPYCVTHAPVTLNAVTPGGTWSGAGITNASTGVFSPAVAGVGTHTIIYTLACGSDSISIKVNNCGSLVACAETNGNITISTGTGPFTWYHQTTSSSCISGFGNCAGPFTIAGPVTTTWTNFATGTTITPGATYPIYVVNTNHDSLYITSFASLPSCVSCPTLTVTPAGQINAGCSGQSTGSFNASTAGGASPYDYTLVNAGGTVAVFNNVAGSQAFTGLAAGTYTLNVLDNAGCPGSVTITITQPVALSVSITASVNPTCSGTNGSATAQASNGTSPYDYVWTGSAGTLQTTNNITVANTLSNLAAGTYTITITDNNNCTASTTVTLANAAAPTVAITAQTNVLCFGASTGSATATASSGSSPYDYVWTNAGGTIHTDNNIPGASTAPGLAAGTYTVTVTDNNNCVATQTVTITQPAVALSVSITASTDASCGSANGSATAQASNGTGPYDYVWTGAAGTLQTTNNVAGGDVLNNLAAGTYTITVTDNNNCTANTTVVINNTGGPTLNITSQANVSCNGGTTGNATVAASGGSSPYDYVWTNAAGTIQTDNNLPGASTSSALAAGTYTVTVTDNTGCISTQIVTITQPAPLSVVMSSTPAGCTANGTATATVAGGTSPYTYAWSPSGGSGSTAVLLASGTYTVIITDNLLCTLADSAIVGNTGGGLTATIAATNVSCNGGSNGSAILTPTSGTGPYSYSWNTTPGQISATATNLPAGTYTCTFTDANLCVGTQSVTITQPAALAVIPSQTNVLCSGASTGSATVTVAGGTIPYTYAWAPSGGSANTATGLGAGNYTCTITDVSLCQTTQAFVITDINPPITSTVTSTPASCSQSNGTANVTAGGGVPAYTYSWSPSGGSTNNATGLNPGNYTVTISDANLCTATGTVTVASTAQYTVTINTTPVSCNGGNNGSATATVTGGTAPFTYQWLPTGGTTTATGNVLTAGSYTLNTTEISSGCQTSTVALITEPALPISVTANAQTICNGQAATIAATAAGGNGAPYTYAWSTGGSAASVSVSPVATTVYTITVTDANSCSAVDTATVYVHQPLALAVSAGDTLCPGQSATLTATAGGGNGNYTIVWTPGNLSGSPVIVSPASTTIYTATLTDGCTVGTVSATVNIAVLPVPIVTFGTNPASGCSPLCPLFAGVATTVAGNNVNPLSWTWNFGDGTTATGVNAAHCYTTPGTYHPSLTGVTTQGCSDSSVNSNPVYVYPDPLADFTASSFTASIYDNTIAFTSLSTGVISSYDWNFANQGSSTAPNPSYTFEPEGTYQVTLTVQNSMGCTDNITKTIVILPEYTFYVPNAFSPGGSDALNDAFLPLGTGWDPDKFDFWVFDRWGNKIFHTSDINNGWNGKANGGKEVAQIDTYVWMVKHYDVFGKYHEYRGIVSLIK